MPHGLCQTRPGRGSAGWRGAAECRRKTVRAAPRTGPQGCQPSMCFIRWRLAGCRTRPPSKGYRPSSPRYRAGASLYRYPRSGGSSGHRAFRRGAGARFSCSRARWQASRASCWRTNPVPGLDALRTRSTSWCFSGAWRAMVRRWLFVLHDRTLAARYCDRVLVMNHGRIHADVAPGEVLTGPVLEDCFGIKRSIRRVLAASCSWCRRNGSERARRRRVPLGVARGEGDRGIVSTPVSFSSGHP